MREKWSSRELEGNEGTFLYKSTLRRSVDLDMRPHACEAGFIQLSGSEKEVRNLEQSWGLRPVTGWDSKI